jgi:flagellar biosynthesis/type III secretory pathway protein FliH
VLSRAEFLGSDTTAADDDDRNDRFDYLDSNHDNLISRSEWHGGDNAFRALDRNGDNALSRSEVVGDEQPVAQESDWFRTLDVDRNGRITPDEWHWSRAGFDRRDRNNDGAITRDELGIAPPRTSQNQVYDQGYARGLTDGRKAGKDDKERAGRWDLEGQRELEQADAGYRPELGARADYQNGYRTGFRAGYPEGFGRKPNQAYDQGYARGLTDGRQAGKEDKQRAGRWDLEGQRELEQADAGYRSELGARADYQTGYRIGFRAGYPEGFGRKPNTR